MMERKPAGATHDRWSASCPVKPNAHPRGFSDGTYIEPLAVPSSNRFGTSPEAKGEHRGHANVIKYFPIADDSKCAIDE